MTQSKLNQVSPPNQVLYINHPFNPFLLQICWYIPFFSEFSVKLFAESRFDTVITLETNPLQNDDAADSIQPSTLANYVFFFV